jgi:molybdate transport system regulatory protein
MPRTKPGLTVRPRIRITRGEVIVMGPGKADLLDAIKRTGSIRAAAADMGMSYMRAWGLVRTMNEQFRQPLVEKTRGGTVRGGAILTPLGSSMLDLYREMERQAVRAIAPAVRKLRSRLTS